MKCLMRICEPASWLDCNWKTDLRRALERGDSAIFINQSFALASGEIAGFEALFALAAILHEACLGRVNLSRLLKRPA